MAVIEALDDAANASPAAARIRARLVTRPYERLGVALGSRGRRNRHNTDKAHRMTGWQPRPAQETVLDCARSLLAHDAL
ncbi:MULTISPECIES: hypothetical protein [unclassified Streptomyces]|uniref:hypothetical protein n=1 Tax=unclassified Streptomyces TaxID=2593676 RepID=UPI001EF1DDF0|nr:MULTISPECIES: hypothetical protein [unclassified Streptomyces]